MTREQKTEFIEKYDMLHQNSIEWAKCASGAHTSRNAQKSLELCHNLMEGMRIAANCMGYDVFTIDGRTELRERAII